MSDSVLYEVVDQVAVITLNRPHRLNAWNGELGTSLYDALDEAGADPAVRVIVVTGAGRGFCAGADMDLLQGIGDGGGGGEPERRSAGHPISIPKPVIAAVNGACAGLGLVFALACDLRFAAAGAKLTVAFSRRGLIAEHGISWTLPRLVGQSVAFDLIVSGRVVLAEEALELGVVNRVHPGDELLDRTLEYANDLVATVSPSSMAVMKQQIYTHPQMSYDAALADSNDLMRASLRRPDFKEGVASFVEKRPPSFRPLEAGEA